jgi:hypothetical protein
MIGARRLRIVRDGTRGMDMGIFSANRPPEHDPTVTADVEGENRGLARNAFVTTRRSLPVATRLPLPVVEGDDRAVGPVNPLIQRVAGGSVLEIEKLLAELEGLRDFLRSKSDRVQREMTRYVHLSDAAMKSTKIIADSVLSWKGAMDDGRGGTDLSAAQQDTTPAETARRPSPASTPETEMTCAS